MDEELGKNLIVGSLMVHKLEPHVHDCHIIVVLYEPLADLEQLGKEFEALIVDQVVKEERCMVTFTPRSSAQLQSLTIALRHEVAESVEHLDNHATRRGDVDMSAHGWRVAD